MRNNLARDNIDKIIKIIKSENKGYSIPIVTKISRDGNPFTVLISCLLSLRTKDAVTEEASLQLFTISEDPEGLAAARLADIEKAIYPVGFYRVKARRIQDICRVLLDKYGGRVPDEIEELLKLKGVGRKTANLVVTLGYHKPGICVDTHVHRISNRLGLVKTRPPDETERELRKILPQRYWRIYNDLLVTFGQNICVPVSPKCSICKISSYCNRVGIKQSR